MNRHFLTATFAAFLVAVGGVALSGPALANLILTPTPDHTGYKQGQNKPCVIGDTSCNDKNFIYTSASGTPNGPGGAYDLTSPTYQAVTSGYFDTDLIPVSFILGIDENLGQGQGPEVLEFFRTFDCGTSSCTGTGTLDPNNSYTGPTDIPNEANGTGWTDALLSTFSLIPGNFYYFEVSVSNDTDGMEQFFIIPSGTPTGVPEPDSLGLFGIGLVGIAGGLIVYRRNRRL